LFAQNVLNLDRETLKSNLIDGEQAEQNRQESRASINQRRPHSAVAFVSVMKKAKSRAEDERIEKNSKSFKPLQKKKEKKRKKSKLKLKLNMNKVKQMKQERIPSSDHKDQSEFSTEMDPLSHSPNFNKETWDNFLERQREKSNLAQKKKLQKLQLERERLLKEKELMKRKREIARKKAFEAAQKAKTKETLKKSEGKHQIDEEERIKKELKKRNAQFAENARRRRLLKEAQISFEVDEAKEEKKEKRKQKKKKKKKKNKNKEKLTNTTKRSRDSTENEVLHEKLHSFPPHLPTKTQKSAANEERNFKIDTPKLPVIVQPEHALNQIKKQAVSECRHKETSAFAKDLNIMQKMHENEQEFRRVENDFDKNCDYYENDKFEVDKDQYNSLQAEQGESWKTYSDDDDNCDYLANEEKNEDSTEKHELNQTLRTRAKAVIQNFKTRKKELTIRAEEKVNEREKAPDVGKIVQRRKRTRNKKLKLAYGIKSKRKKRPTKKDTPDLSLYGYNLL